MADFITKPSKQTRKLFGLVCGIDGNKMIIGHNAKSCGIARKLNIKVYNNQYKVMIPKNRDDIKYLNKHSAPIKWDEKKIINKNVIVWGIPKRYSFVSKLPSNLNEKVEGVNFHVFKVQNLGL